MRILEFVIVVGLLTYVVYLLSPSRDDLIWLKYFPLAHSTAKCNGEVFSVEENLTRSAPARRARPRPSCATWAALGCPKTQGRHLPVNGANPAGTCGHGEALQSPWPSPREPGQGAGPTQEPLTADRQSSLLRIVGASASCGFVTKTNAAFFLVFVIFCHAH
jgi:hypothetical protein